MTTPTEIQTRVVSFLEATLNYDPKQPRDKYGKWSAVGTEWERTHAIYGPGGIGKTTGLIPVKLATDKKGNPINAKGKPLAKGEARHYISPTGAKVPEHIKTLGLPPAWTGVMVNPDGKAKYQAAGIDASGKIQPKYLKAFQDSNKDAHFDKIDKMLASGDDVKMIAQNAKNRKTAGNDIELIDHANAFAVMSETGMRVGGSTTNTKIESFGTVDLQGRHVIVNGAGQVSLRFVPGKKRGQTVTIPVSDPYVASELKRQKKLAGPTGELFPEATQPSMYLYVKSLNAKYTPKDMRIRKATTMAQAYVSSTKVHGRFNSEASYQKWLKGMLAHVAKQIPDTPAVLFKSYISPSVYSRFAPKG